MFKKKKKDEATLEMNDEVVELENIEKPKKDFTIPTFIFKIIVSVLLISFAILLFVEKDKAFFIIFITTASVVLLVGLVRIVALIVRKEENDKVKKLVLILSAIHAAIAIYLIIAGIIYNKEANGNEGFSEFSLWNRKNYPMFLAAILYSESVGYFMNTTLFKKNSTKLFFWLHIAFITLAVLILSLGNNFNGSKMVTSLAVISLVCAGLTILDASLSLYHYSKKNKEDNDDKKDEPLEFKPLDESNDDEEVAEENTEDDNLENEE